MSLVFIENNQPQFGAGLQKAETASQITYGQGTVDDALSQLNNDIANLGNDVFNKTDKVVSNTSGGATWIDVPEGISPSHRTTRLFMADNDSRPHTQIWENGAMIVHKDVALYDDIRATEITDYIFQTEFVEDIEHSFTDCNGYVIAHGIMRVTKAIPAIALKPLLAFGRGYFAKASFGVYTLNDHFMPCYAFSSTLEGGDGNIYPCILFYFKGEVEVGTYINYGFTYKKA